MTNEQEGVAPNDDPGAADAVSHGSRVEGARSSRTRRGIVGNLDVREAAHLAEELNVGLVMPTHYDLFAGNGADPGEFVSFLYRLNPNRPHKLLRVGELHAFVREG